jgi:hypothetical protein
MILMNSESISLSEAKEKNWDIMKYQDDVEKKRGEQTRLIVEDLTHRLVDLDRR